MFIRNRERILFIVLAIIGVILTLNTSSALAIDPDGCVDDPPMPNCLGKLTIEDMGHFDVNDQWIWDGPEVSGIQEWAINGGQDDWQTRWAPQKVDAQVSDSRMDFKHFPNKPNHVRVAVTMTSSATRIPKIWKVEGGYQAFFIEPPGCEPTQPDGDYSGPAECIQECEDDENCDPLTVWNDLDGNGVIDCTDPHSPGEWCEFRPDFSESHPNSCCWLWRDVAFDTEEDGPFTADRFGTIYWTNKDVTTSLSLVDNTCMYGINYNNAREVMEWVDAGWSDCFYDSYFVFPDNIDPGLGTNTFILTYDGDKTVELKYYVINNDPMPVVPAQYTQAVTMDAGRSGKQIETGQTITVDNITARGINGALVIQWAEPDLAMFPDPNAWRKELQCSVGTPYPGDWAGQTVPGHLLWIGSPYQIGSIVIPPHIFEFIKDKIRPDGNQLEIQFQYRFKYPPTEQQKEEGYWIYQNRGYGEPISIDFE